MFFFLFFYFDVRESWWVKSARLTEIHTQVINSFVNKTITSSATATTKATTTVMANSTSGFRIHAECQCPLRVCEHVCVCVCASVFACESFVTLHRQRRLIPTIYDWEYARKCSLRTCVLVNRSSILLNVQTTSSQTPLECTENTHSWWPKITTREKIKHSFDLFLLEIII